MKILTIDSASESFSVSIFDEDKVLSEVFLKRTGKQLTYLAKSIDYAFSMSGLDRKDIELVCVSSGPGSFTGIRLAEVTAMTFGQTVSVPIAQINTLDSVYEAVKFYKKNVAVAFDARRDEIFTAIYGDDKRLTDYLAVSVKEFNELLKKYEIKFVTGNAITRYGANMKIVAPEIEFANEFFWYPHGFALASIGLEMYKNGEVVSFNEVRPFYMRKPEAEETREKKLKEQVEKKDE